MKIGGLCRASTEKQSTASQREAITEWAADHGHEVMWYEEPPGTSGGLPLAQRHETVRLLTDAAEKRIDAIAMCEVSRLNRLEAVENFVAIAQLWLAKTPLYVLDHDESAPLDLTDLGDFLRIAFECGFAAEERKKDSLRTSRGLANVKARAAREGRPHHIGNPGYQWTPEQDAELLRLSDEMQMTALEIAMSGITVQRRRRVDADGRLCVVSKQPRAGYALIAGPPSETSVKDRLRELRRTPR